MLAPVEEIFCQVDDFCNRFFAETPKKLTGGSSKRNRESSLCASEIITIMMLFHMSHYRTFKDFYYQCVLRTFRPYFPKLVSYNRFVELQSSIVAPLASFLMHASGAETNIYIVDSTPLKVCHNRRIQRHRVFSGIAERGKSSMGWFYGFKLHIVVNHVGELMSFMLTPGNTDDRKPLKTLFKKLKGLAIGDKGYISEKAKSELLEHGIDLVTNARKNMKTRILSPLKKFYLSRRRVVETIIDQFKNIYQIEHTRHRSPTNFLVNLFAGLAAYRWRPNKPAISTRLLPLQNPVLTSN